VGNLLGSLYIGSKSLAAQLAAMRVIGHNIANANTEGYTRQELILQTSIPDMSPVGPIGSGVEAAAIRRMRDSFVEARLRTGMETLARWEKKYEVLSDLEVVFAEPTDDGLSAAMTEFWNRWRDLAGNPEEHGLRASVIEQGATLANTFQYVYNDLRQLRENLDESLSLSVMQANTYIRQIAALNEQIVSAELSGDVAPDLRDQRQLLVQELSTIMDVDIDDSEAANLCVRSHGERVVDGPHYMQLELQYNVDTQMQDVRWAGTQAPLTVEGGSLYSILEGRDTIVPAYMDDLSQLAQDLILAVNRVHSSGRGSIDFSAITSLCGVNNTAVSLANIAETGLAVAPTSGSFQIIVTDSSGQAQTTTISVLDGVTDSLDALALRINSLDHISATISEGKLTVSAESGYTFGFANDTSSVLAALGINTFFSGSGADDISVAPGVAADARLVAAGLSLDAGDGDNASAIAELEYSLTVGSGRWSFSDFYRDMVTGLGVSVQETGRFVAGQENVVNQIADRRASISGVSVDEEAANIIKYQRAYEASAQFIAAVNEMIEYMLLQMM